MEVQNNPPAQAKKLSPKMKKRLIIGATALVVVASVVGLLVWLNLQQRIYTDAAQISAPITDLSPKNSGILEEVLVNPGDTVSADEPIARVGNEIIKAASDGLIVSVNNDIGKNFNPGEVVASMIDPADLRVVGHIEEDKGLKNIEVGQPVTFPSTLSAARNITASSMRSAPLRVPRTSFLTFPINAKSRNSTSRFVLISMLIRN